jgi:hypothetical protein
VPFVDTVPAGDNVPGDDLASADEAMPAGGTVAFAPGASIVRRDTALGRVWGAAPLRVVGDTPDALVVACWQGTRLLSPVSYIESKRTGLPDGRLQLIRELADGTGELGERIWQDTADLTWVSPGEYFSVHRFFDRTEKPGVWYVNFELPARRTAIGYDTCDLCIDLIVAPDLNSYEWKDQDEYEFGRQVGFITDAVHEQIEQAKDRVLTLLAERAGPFAGNWSDWRRDPSWPVPALPANALDVPAAQRPG